MISQHGINLTPDNFSDGGDFIKHSKSINMQSICMKMALIILMLGVNQQDWC